MAEFMVPLDNRKNPGNPEQDHGHDEGPEKLFFPVSERVFLIGRLLAGLQPVKEQNLIECVGDRMEGFGEHRGGSTEECRNKFKDSNPQVPKQGSQYSFFAMMMQQPIP